MNNRTPYTLKWLRSKLDEMVGKENYTLKIDYNSYTLTIRFDAFYSEATEIFKKTLKADTSKYFVRNYFIFLLQYIYREYDSSKEYKN